MSTNRVEETREILEADLDALRQLPGSKKYLAQIAALELHLDDFVEACVDEMRGIEEEELTAREMFDLRYRQLVGLSQEIGALARKKPEQACNAFKAQQVNLVLRPLKDEMEEELDLTLSLVPEDASLSYSDVSLLVRNYLDLSAVYALRQYDLRYYEKNR